MGIGIFQWRLLHCFDQFGVQKPALKALARTPQLPTQNPAAPVSTARDAAPIKWLGASMRNIRDEGEMSAFGLPGVTGVFVLEVPEDTDLAKAGLRKEDVIVSVNGETIPDTAALLKQAPASSITKIGVSRDQKPLTIRLIQ